MAPGELRLDLGLRPAQQIEGPVELVLIDRPQTEDGAQRMRRARLAELASTRATTNASASVASRSGRRGTRRSRPSFLAKPSTAAT